MMQSITKLCSIIFLLTISGPTYGADDGSPVKEQAVGGPHGIAIRVRIEGPYTAEVPLQVVCYFKFTEDGAKRMSGAPVELDKRSGGAINSLRARRIPRR